MTRIETFKKILFCTAPLALCQPIPAFAQEQDTQEVEELRSKVDALQEREIRQLQRLEELEARLSALEGSGEGSAGRPIQPISRDEAAGMRGAYITAQPVALPSDPALVFFRQQDRNRGLAQTRDEPDPLTADGPGDLRAPAPTEAVVEVAEQQQGRFGKRFGLDLGVGYSHFDNARISLNGFLALDAIFLGTISIDQIKSDIFTFDPTLRAGITDELFFDANLPYLYRSSNFRSGGAGGSASALVEETVHDSGIGDLSLGLSYRIAQETSGMPDMVLNARMKFPTGRHPFGVEFIEVADSEGNLQVPESLATGSGVYGASLGVSLLKTLDPMVVFANGTYFHNFSRHFDDIDENEGDIPGQVDIGDAFQIGGGLAFALNDKSSISMSYSQRIVGRTHLQPDGLDRRTVVGSQANVGVLNLGATFSLGERLALVANVGVGLTDDSPDMSVGFHVPYRF